MNKYRAMAMRVIVTTLFCCALFHSANAQTNSNAEAIARAMAALEAAKPKAQADPSHPVFHITSPAEWMNDPNGPIYHNGFYHLFYQLNPFSDGDGPKYWGHVRSRDLAHWEPLTVALCPSNERGEQGVWSGSCTINGLGQPMIFYTSVALDKSPMTHSEQWAAIGDKDLITWQKLDANPVLSDSLHGGKKIYDWRDPFIFKDKHRTFMVVGGNLNEARGGQAVVNLYEAQNPALTEWRYLGVLFQIPDADARTAECPNFFKLGDHWVLITSPYNRPEYFIGDFDADAGQFTSRSSGTLDCDGHFYAPNTMQLADGRRILWGWINGFPGGRGWNGCLSLPRVLSLMRDGQLRQTPAPQLIKLRGKSIAWHNLSIGDAVKIFALPKTNALEISAVIDLGNAEEVNLSLKGVVCDASPVVVSLSESKFKMLDVDAPLPASRKAGELRVHMFIDHSVLEVFANDQVCVTKLLSPPYEVEALEISAKGGMAKGKLIEAWPMKSIWK